jgi:DNA-binding LacI/PurR family transcriptional regulator
MLSFRKMRYDAAGGRSKRGRGRPERSVRGRAWEGRDLASKNAGTPPLKRTIRDVARLSGVSLKTVSRVMNRESGVSEATRARVLRVVEEIGYNPHSGARSMRGSLPNSVGLTLGAPPSRVPFSNDLLTWIFTQLYRSFGANGAYVTFDLDPYAGGRNADYARALWEQLCRGLVVMGPLSVEDRVIHRVHASGHPYLVIGRLSSLPECSSASVDYGEGVMLAARHLVARGHREIAMLSGFEGLQAGKDRWVGFHAAMAEAGIPFDPERRIGHTLFAPEDIVANVRRLLEDRKVTALLEASGAEDGESIREGIRQAGRVPGRDVEIVSWTYTNGGAVLEEACAHVWVPLREAIVDGLQQFAAWYEGEREGPVNVLYRPALHDTTPSGQVQKPRYVFSSEHNG